MKLAIFISGCALLAAAATMCSLHAAHEWEQYRAANGCYFSGLYGVRENDGSITVLTRYELPAYSPWEILTRYQCMNGDQRVIWQ